MSAVVDCFLFAGEQAMLELRLRTLNPVVETFVAVACTRTHQGQPVDRARVERAFTEATQAAQVSRAVLFWLTPSNILDRGQGVVLERAPEERGPAGGKFFQHIEKQHRNSMCAAVKELRPAGTDVVLMSDVDEIPTPAAVASAQGLLAHASMWLVCAQRFHSTSLSLLHPQQPWWGTCIARYNDMYPQAHRDARTTIGQPGQSVTVIEKGGWHFSWFGTDEERQEKLDSFSHAELRGRFDVVDGRRARYHSNGEKLIYLSKPECELLDWPAPLVTMEADMGRQFFTPESWYTEPPV